MISKWNGMQINLSGSRAKITPAPITLPRDIGTMQMQRTYEVVRVKPQYGDCYYSPCLLLDGRPTSMHGRIHHYPRTARKALAKWAAQIEADLANATITDDGENTSWEGVPMWTYHFAYVYKGNAHLHGYEQDRIVASTRRCSFDASVEIVCD